MMNYSLGIHLFKRKVSSVECVHSLAACYCIITINDRESMIAVRATCNPVPRLLLHNGGCQCESLIAQTVSFNCVHHIQSLFQQD